MDKLSRIIDTVLSETVDSSNIILEEFNFEDSLNNIVRVARNHIKKAAIDIMEDGIVNGSMDRIAGQEVIKAIVENDGEIHKRVNGILLEGGKLDGLKRIDNILSENISDKAKIGKIRNIVHSGRLCEDELDVILEDIELGEDKYKRLLKMSVAMVASFALRHCGDKKDEIEEIFYSSSLSDPQKKNDILKLCGYEPKKEEREVADDFDIPVNIPTRSAVDSQFADVKRSSSTEGFLDEDEYNSGGFPIIGRKKNGLLVTIKSDDYSRAVKPNKIDKVFNKMFERGGGKIKYSGYNGIYTPYGIYGYGSEGYKEHSQLINSSDDIETCVIIRSIYDPISKKYLDLNSLMLAHSDMLT